MREVRDLARLRDESIGRTLSSLARRALAPEQAPEVRIEDGIPVWIAGPAAIPVTSQFVRSLLEEE